MSKTEIAKKWASDLFMKITDKEKFANHKLLEKTQKKAKIILKKLKERRKIQENNSINSIKGLNQIALFIINNDFL